MANPYLDYNDEQQLALLQSTGNTPADEVALGRLPDPSVAPEAAAAPELTDSAPAQALTSDVADPKSVVDAQAATPPPSTPPPTAGPGDSLPGLRERAIKSLMDTKYPDRAADDGKVFSDRGVSKMSQAFYAAGGGKSLPASFFAPEDNTDATKKAGYEIQRANAIAALMGRTAGGKAGAGAKESPEAYRSWAEQEYPKLKSRNPEAWARTGLDEMKAMVTAAGGAENRFTRKDFHGDLLERQERQDKEMNDQRAFQREAVVKARQYKLTEDQGKALVGYSKTIAPDAPIGYSLEDLESLAPGITTGKLTPETAQMMDGLNKLASNPMWRGWGSRIMEDKAIKLQAELAYFNQRVARPEVGSNFTEPEMANFARILNSAAGSSPQAQAQSIAMVAGQFKRKMLEKRAAAMQLIPDENVWRQYKRDGGMVFGLSEGTAAPQDPASPPSPSDEAGINTLLQETYGKGRAAIGGAVKDVVKAVAPTPQRMGPPPKAAPVIHPDTIIDEHGNTIHKQADGTYE